MSITFLATVLQCIDAITNFVLLAPFLACLHGRRREKADFAACEQQISQSSLRVRADYTGCPPSLIYCSLIPKHEISEISLCKYRIFTCWLLHLSFPLI